MIEAVWLILQALLWPVVLIIAAIAAAINFLLPWVALLAGAAVVLTIIGLAIGAFFSSSIWGKLKIIAWIIGLSAMFAAPYFIHNRGWDAFVALGLLLAGFTYNQVREL